MKTILKLAVVFSCIFAIEFFGLLAIAKSEEPARPRELTGRQKLLATIEEGLVSIGHLSNAIFTWSVNHELPGCPCDEFTLEPDDDSFEVLIRSVGSSLRSISVADQDGMDVVTFDQNGKPHSETLSEADLAKAVGLAGSVASKIMALLKISTDEELLKYINSAPKDGTEV